MACTQLRRALGNLAGRRVAGLKPGIDPFQLLWDLLLGSNLVGLRTHNPGPPLRASKDLGDVRIIQARIQHHAQGKTLGAVPSAAKESNGADRLARVKTQLIRHAPRALAADDAPPMQFVCETKSMAQGL